MGRSNAKNNRLWTRVGVGLMAPIVGLFTSGLGLVVPAFAAGCSAPGTDLGSVNSTIAVPSSGTYRVWSRIMAPDTTNNTYLLDIDGATCNKVGGGPVPANSWVWVDYQDGDTASLTDTNLTAGNHALKLIGNQPGVKVDRVLFVADTTCVPTGTGDNCAAVATQTPPSVAITAPNEGDTLTGATTIAITAADNSGTNGPVTVDLFINGTLKSSKNAAPYDVAWDTTTVPNGPYTIVAKATDALGNSNSATINVTVKNGDTQPPTVPSGLKASATGPKNVALSWDPSTDNVGVAGYKIVRNGSVITQVSASPTQYNDANVLPNTEYSYQVEAFDAAGNVSAPSATATTTTPQVPNPSDTPAAPVNLAATAGSSSQVNLRWDDPNTTVTVNGYDIYRATNGGTATKIATAPSTSFGDTGLEGATKYSYYVVAISSAGKPSKPSGTIAVTTPPVPAPVGIIKGTVLDRNGRKITGARLTLLINHKRYFASTNSRGEYSISGLPTGRYTLQVSARGYQPQLVVGKLNLGEVKVHNLRLRKR